MTDVKDKPPPAKDGQSGRFLPGNNGGPGRPKGARSMLAEAFIESLQKTWSEHGDAVLSRLVDEDPASVLRAMIAIMPKELDPNVNRYDDMSLEQLKAQFQAAVREAHMLGIDLVADDEPSVH
jgi:hypothetical protein